MMALGTHECFAVVEVTSEPEHLPGDYVMYVTRVNPQAITRWPWVSRTVPRFVPTDPLHLTADAVGISRYAFRGGYKQLTVEQFTQCLVLMAEAAGVATVDLNR